ncbi:MAG: GntR family transcriptional regulator [Pirellulales bacterium]|nr:GntR family transcriptional regulator [Pirellulales bacterium]
MNRPKYRLLRDHIHAEISSGRLAPGSALPTEAEICEKLGMSRNTVRQALGELESEGLVERFPGRGTFVTTEQQKHAHQQLNMYAFIAPQLRSGAYPSLIHGFEQTCAGFQHETIVGNSGNDIGRQADLIVRLVDQAVGGVALVPTTAPPTPAHQIRLLQKQHIPVVFCHRTVEGVAAPAVIYSGREVGLKAGRALGELGHRRIAFLYAHRYSMAEAYGQGLRDAFVDSGLDPAGVVSVEYGSKLAAPAVNAEKAIQQYLTGVLAAPDRPTAIFCGNAPDAEVAYLHATAAGLKIPEDLSLAYVGSSWREHGLAGRITCIAIDEYEIGAQAARLLNEMRSGERPLDNGEQFVFPAALLPGETLGPASGG